MADRLKELEEKVALLVAANEATAKEKGELALKVSTLQAEVTAARAMESKLQEGPPAQKQDRSLREPLKPGMFRYYRMLKESKEWIDRDTGGLRTTVIQIRQEIDYPSQRFIITANRYMAPAGQPHMGKLLYASPEAPLAIRIEARYDENGRALTKLDDGLTHETQVSGAPLIPAFAHSAGQGPMTAARAMGPNVPGTAPFAETPSPFLDPVQPTPAFPPNVGPTQPLGTVPGFVPQQIPGEFDPGA